MARPLKQQTVFVQLVIILSFYIGFGILGLIINMMLCSGLTGYSYLELRDADISIPKVIFIWKLIIFTDPIEMFLIPALVFTGKPMEWNKKILLKPALVVTVIALAMIPVSGFLYDWNYSLGIGNNDEHSGEISKVVMTMHNFVSLPIGMLLYAAVPAIARMCFFLGVLQHIFLKMLPKAPWIAILITSVIFSVSFFDWDWLFPLIFLGFMLGSIYYLTGNLWLAILANFIFTSVDWVKSYLYQTGITNEDPLNPSATHWYTAFAGLLIIAVVVWNVRKSIPKPVVVVNDYQTDIDEIGK